MFTKTGIFVFCLVGVFALLFGTMTAAFYANQGIYTASAGATKTIASSLDLANVTIYSQAGSDNMTFPYSSYHDHPSAPKFQVGLPAGQYLEVYWGFYGNARALEFRHTTEVWWGLTFIRMNIYTKAGGPLGKYLLEHPLSYQHLTDNWDADANASIFYTYTPIAASYLIQYDQAKYSSISDAWSSGELGYTISYELDINATQMNVWGILGSLLVFNAPALGMTGIGGYVLNMLIAIPTYIMSAILFVKSTLAIIPFIQGLRE